MKDSSGNFSGFDFVTSFSALNNKLIILSHIYPQVAELSAVLQSYIASFPYPASFTFEKSEERHQFKIILNKINYILIKLNANANQPLFSDQFKSTSHTAKLFSNYRADLIDSLESVRLSMVHKYPELVEEQSEEMA